MTLHLQALKKAVTPTVPGPAVVPRRLVDTGWLECFDPRAARCFERQQPAHEPAIGR